MSDSGRVWQRDAVVEPGFGGWIETTGFQQSIEQAFATDPPVLEFGLNTGKCECREMQFQGFEHAHESSGKRTDRKADPQVPQLAWRNRAAVEFSLGLCERCAEATSEPR